MRSALHSLNRCVELSMLRRARESLLVTQAVKNCLLSFVEKVEIVIYKMVDAYVTFCRIRICDCCEI